MIDFVAVGPQKTGTTWIYEMLRKHSKLCFPRNVKETMFFDKYYDQGIRRYQSYFQHAEEGQTLAEVAPSYFDHQEIPCRIHKLNPQCKILISLRNPTERTFSLYCHHLQKGRVPKDFSQATKRMPRILESGHYSRFVPLWLEMFSREQVLFVLTDDIKAQPSRVLQKICNFANVSTDSLPNDINLSKKVNQASMPKFRSLARFATNTAERLRALQLDKAVEVAKKVGLKRVYSGGEGNIPRITPDERQFLSIYYENDVRYVENLLNRPLPTWRDG